MIGKADLYRIAGWARWMAAAGIILSTASIANAQSLKAGGGRQWYRGNTHTHTLWSDGDAAPEVAVAWYKDHGYNFLGLSDHNILSNKEQWSLVAPEKKLTPERVEAIKKQFGEDWVQTRTMGAETYMRLKTLDEIKRRFDEPRRFLMIPAEEISASVPPVHINAVNVEELILPFNGKPAWEAIQNTMDRVEEQSKRLGIPMFAHVNHPNWNNGVAVEDIIKADKERYFEVYNGHAGVNNWGKASKGFPPTDRLWDIILSARLAAGAPPILGMGTDDTHDYFKIAVGECNPGRGWIMVLAEKLTPESIVGAVLRGDFYATSGVLLDEVAASPKSLKVSIKAQPGVKYKTRFIATMKNADLSSKPSLDQDGKPRKDTTRVYSDEIGRVLLETEENPAVYRVTGDEFYVRAKVISDKLQPNPFAEGDFETAWTQPLVVKR